MSSLITAVEQTFLPLTIIIAITSVLGLLGNGLSFYIFSRRFPPSGFNSLMAALAAFDFIASLVHMPLDIATFFEVGGSRKYLCKITCFQLAFTASGSALVLMAIAFVRYYGIHKPLLGTLSPRLANYIILGSSLMAVGVSLPITILFGEGKLVTDANITAEICAVEEQYMDTIGPLAFYMVLASLYIITFIVHTCLYIRAVHTVWNRRRVFVSMRGKNNVVMLSPAPPRSRPVPEGSPMPSRSLRPATAGIHSPLTRIRNGSSSSQQPLFARVGGANTLSRLPEDDLPSSSSISVTEISDADSNIEETGSQPTPRLPRKQPLKRLQPKRVTALSLPQAPPTRSSTLSNSPKKAGGASGVNQTSYRVLGVVIAISLTYFLSYAPHFGVMFYLFTHDMTVFAASAQNLAFELLMRSFFLNNILDPLIYGLLSTDFRKELRLTLLSLVTVCRGPKH
ncbi:uncharacterized protein LOC101856169 [Aplysia californica]|uniref:Uncharacterized protein LOC101856169 n=1 Tax=Aplysia californica TaxID=6500 RepID=A0ABM0ZWL6_APLCA|nr:uncharacterized protein LOC101856169 [Aplysia californica]